MRFILTTALASVIAATPALANEARVDVTGGAVWNHSDTEATIGATAGYDFDLQPSGGFVGVEGTVQKVLAGGYDVEGNLGVRAGAHLTPTTKVYGLAGYTLRQGIDTPNLGAGVQQNIANKLYVKAEYKHNFVKYGLPDYDSAVAGVGLRF